MCASTSDGPVGPLDHLGRGKGFSRAGDAEQDLMLFARLNAARELVDGVRLIAARLVIAHEFEVHRLWLARRHREAAQNHSL